MEEGPENLDEKNAKKGESGNVTAFKPSIIISRKQTRRLTVQVDEEKAALFDEYVRFVSDCFSYEVGTGEVMNEILKAHFARDAGFKGWRISADRNAKSSD